MNDMNAARMAHAPASPADIPVRPLAALFQAADTVIASFSRNLARAVFYTNAEEIGLTAFARHMAQTTYRACAAMFEDVRIGRLEAGSLILGGNSLWVVASGCLVRDQINPLTEDVSGTLKALAELPFPLEEIREPSLLLGRYGDVTWGHWLAEILPRAVIAEHMFPGRFSYVVGAPLLAGEDVAGYAMRIRESLAAYGIDESRLIRLAPDRHYVFASLHAVSGIWSAAGMNPEVMRIMRENLAPNPGFAGPGRLAVLRHNAATRGIANRADIDAILAAHDFTTIDMARQGFCSQAAYFKGAHSVFGILGSELAGLIYAPEGVKIVTLGPGAWEDTYFHTLIKLRDGWHADIRCPPLWDGTGLERDAPLFALRRPIETALQRIAEPPDATNPVTIAGTKLHRHVGDAITAIDFGSAGLGPAFLQAGWANPESHHTWSIGPRSSLRIPAPFEAGLLELQLSLFVITAKDFLPAQRLDITVNGTQIGSLALHGQTTISCDLPAHIHQHTDSLNIVFDHPFCISARATGLAPDDRPLGIGLIALRIIRREGA